VSCYYCGEDNNDVNEHIPPKSMFKGVNQFHNNEAMKGVIIDVPSCKKHNTDTSLSDDLFVYLICSMAMGSHYAFNVSATQLKNLAEMYKNNFDLFRQRFSLIGCTILKNDGEKAFDPGNITKADKNAILRINALKCYRGVAYYQNRHNLPDDSRLLVEWDSHMWDQHECDLMQYSLNPSEHKFVCVSGNSNVFWSTWITEDTLLMTFYDEVRCRIRKAN
jgi:hypothetical protein